MEEVHGRGILEWRVVADRVDVRSAPARAGRCSPPSPTRMRARTLRGAAARRSRLAALPSSRSGSRCSCSPSPRPSPRSASRSSSASTCSSTSCIGDLAPLCLLAGLTGPMLRPLLAFRPVERLRVLANPAVALPIWAVEPLPLARPVPLRGGGRTTRPCTRSSTSASSPPAMIMWLPVLETLPAPEWFGTGPKLAYIAVVRLSRRCSATSSSGPARSSTTSTRRGEELWGISPLRDQGLAGAVMMIEGSLVTIAALAWLFLRLAQEGELRQELLERGLDPRAVQRAVRYGRAQELAEPPLNSFACARPASTTSTWSSPRSSAACPSTATCSGRSASTASARSRASAARRSGTSAGRAARSGSGRRRASAGIDRYRVGLHHLALEASSRAVVDERHAWLVGSGAEIESAAAGVRLHAGLLRRLLLRPGRDQARDRPRARARRLRLGRR